MSVATANTVDFFDAAIEKLREAATAHAKTGKDLEKAIDEIIPLAINKAIAVRNCNALDKINTTLRGVNSKLADKFRKNFTDYCHASDGLGMPKETIFYASALNRFMCDIDAMSQWQEENPSRLETAVKLSEWLKAQKTTKKPVSADKAIKDSLTRAIKTIESYGLHRTNTDYQTLVSRMKILIGE